MASNSDPPEQPDQLNENETLTRQLENLSLQQPDVVPVNLNHGRFSDAQRLGGYFYREIEYHMNINQEPLANAIPGNMTFKYKVNVVNTVNLVQGYDNRQRTPENQPADKEVKQIHFLNWILNHLGNAQDQLSVNGETGIEKKVDFVIRRKTLSILLSLRYNESRTELTIARIKNSFFIFETPPNNIQRNSDERKAYAGCMLGHYMCNETGQPVQNFHEIRHNDILNENHYVSVIYRELSTANTNQTHKILAAVNSDCLLNRNEPRIYCEIKCREIKLEPISKWCRELRFFAKWWGAVNRDRLIQYLRLSDIPHELDRNIVLKNLIGDARLEAYLNHCIANASTKLLIGFYYIREDTNFENYELDTIIEVDVTEIERYLTTKGYHIHKCFDFLSELFTSIKRECSQNNITYHLHINQNEVRINQADATIHLLPQDFMDQLNN